MPTLPCELLAGQGEICPVVRWLGLYDYTLLGLSTQPLRVFSGRGFNTPELDLPRQGGVYLRGAPWSLKAMKRLLWVDLWVVHSPPWDVATTCAMSTYV